MTTLSRIRKALVAGLLAAASAAGIVVAELDWWALIGAAIVAGYGVWQTPNTSSEVGE